MTKKRRSLKQQNNKPSTIAESDDDSDCEQKKKEDLGKRRVLRSRTSTLKPVKDILLKKPSESDCKDASDKGLDAYDADSETDLKLSKKSSGDYTSSDCDEFVLMKPKISLAKLKALSPVIATDNASTSQKKAVSSRKNLKNLKDFSVNLEDCMQPGDNIIKMIQTPGNTTSINKKRSHNDQENVTPPDVHSTPCFGKFAKKLDPSLFGFNDNSDEVEKKLLNYSSVKMDSVSAPLSPSVVNNSNLSSTSFSGKTYSRSKRKTETPVETTYTTTAPTKKKRSKKKKKNEEPDRDDLNRENEMWEQIRQEFREVDMHELVIE